MFEVCAERGASNVTVAHLVARAGISRRTFYEIFKDCDQCFLAALEEAVARASRRVLPMYGLEEPWEQRIRASLEALLAFFDSDPATARLLVVETLRANPPALERRERLVARLVEAIDEGRVAAKRGVHLSSLTAEGVVGAVLSILHSRILAGGGLLYEELSNKLMSIVVLPYRGPLAAREELKRPLTPRKPPPSPSPNPLARLGIRLTYRTVRVLLAVGEHPGGSNREVAQAADVNDQGQISKLLARLQRLGLIENANDLPTNGLPNAWTLTAKGQEVRDALGANGEALRRA
jgi:AcrR family transcriptional regulator/DNA-binding MarR family transcriptional regulator